MELRDVRLALRRYWVLAVLVFLLCLALGAAAAFLPAKTYRARASISSLIDPDTNPGNPSALIDYEMDNIEVLAGSPILVVQVESPDPRATAVWANAVANAIIDTNPEESRLILRLAGPAFTP